MQRAPAYSISSHPVPSSVFVCTTKIPQPNSMSKSTPRVSLFFQSRSLVSLSLALLLRTYTLHTLCVALWENLGILWYPHRIYFALSLYFPSLSKPWHWFWEELSNKLFNHNFLYSFPVLANKPLVKGYKKSNAND